MDNGRIVCNIWIWFAVACLVIGLGLIIRKQLKADPAKTGDASKDNTGVRVPSHETEESSGFHLPSWVLKFIVKFSGWGAGLLTIGIWILFNCHSLGPCADTKAGEKCSDCELGGMVTDANSGEPVGSAAISEEGTETVTLTNQDGNFVINAINMKTKLFVRKEGYECCTLCCDLPEPNPQLIKLVPIHEK